MFAPRCANCGANDGTATVRIVSMPSGEVDKVCEPCAGAMVRAYPGTFVRAPECFVPREDVPGFAGTWDALDGLTIR